MSTTKPEDELPEYRPVPESERGHPVYLTRGEWTKHAIALVVQLASLIGGFWWFSVKMSAAIESRFTKLEVKQEAQTELIKETRDDIKELRRNK